MIFFFPSVSLSNFISRLLFFSRVIQCDSVDGYHQDHEDAKNGGF